MVVKGVHIDFPHDFVRGSVLNGDRQISAVVEPAEFRRFNSSSSGSVSFGLRRCCLLLGLQERRGFSSDTATLFEHG